MNGWFFANNGALLRALAVAYMISPTKPSAMKKSYSNNGTCVWPVVSFVIGLGNTIWKKSSQ